MSYIIGWVCIGLGAALAVCILPFRRGLLGVCLNVTSAVLGAIAAPSFGVTLGLSPRDPRELPLAALGALTLMALMHLAWNRARPNRRHTRRRSAV